MGKMPEADLIEQYVYAARELVSNLLELLDVQVEALELPGEHLLLSFFEAAIEEGLEALDGALAFVLVHVLVLEKEDGRVATDVEGRADGGQLGLVAVDQAHVHALAGVLFSEGVPDGRQTLAVSAPGRVELYEPRAILNLVSPGINDVLLEILGGDDSHLL